jgi:hypothetical protein
MAFGDGAGIIQYHLVGGWVSSWVKRAQCPADSLVETLTLEGDYATPYL